MLGLVGVSLPPYGRDRAPYAPIGRGNVRSAALGIPTLTPSSGSCARAVRLIGTLVLTTAALDVAAECAQVEQATEAFHQAVTSGEDTVAAYLAMATASLTAYERGGLVRAAATRLGVQPPEGHDRFPHANELEHYGAAVDRLLLEEAGRRSRAYVTEHTAQQEAYVLGKASDDDRPEHERGAGGSGLGRTQRPAAPAAPTRPRPLDSRRGGPPARRGRRPGAPAPGGPGGAAGRRSGPPRGLSTHRVNPGPRAPIGDAAGGAAARNALGLPVLPSGAGGATVLG